MDANSGQIFLDLCEEEAKKRGLQTIPREQAEAVINMNRKQRRAWAAEQRRAAKERP